ncbi:ANR16 protein, partial [Hypocryptadius cinnamomeus]|nr:ANR16 protein [Hypocryptadius cinnamomeus]
RLLRLVQEGNLALLRDELRLDEAPEAPSWRWGRLGDSLLHHAARLGHRDVLEFLVREIGMDTEVANGDYKRPLHEAASMGHQDCVSFLLERGASVDCLKKADWNEFFPQEKQSLVRTSRKMGIFPSGNPQTGLLEFLVSLDQVHLSLAQIGQVYPWSVHELYIFHFQSQLLRVSFHKDLGAAHSCVLVFSPLPSRCQYKPDSRDSCGVTPFMDALQNGHVSIARLLLEKHQACPTAVDALGAQALHRAAVTAQDGSIQFLVSELGVDVNGTATSLQLPALHYAAKEGHGHTIQTLLSLGADLQAKDGKGRSALHVASAGQCAEAAGILLRAGLRDAPDATGMLAQQLARRPDVIQVFQGTPVST